MNQLWEKQLIHGYIVTRTSPNWLQLHHLSEIEVEGVVSFTIFPPTTWANYTIYVNNSIVAEHRAISASSKRLKRNRGQLGSVDRTGTLACLKHRASVSAIRNLLRSSTFTPFHPAQCHEGKRHNSETKSRNRGQGHFMTTHDNIRYMPQDNKTLFFRTLKQGNALSKAHAMGQMQSSKV